ncbi:MAG: UDP-N-acetylmuramoyl-L-alanine--D-glutamate ligase [Eubacterium sp.]|nr:UDP-N-acetylmuramoyl-L-alanine--D-glutamate ligase [Eubacterium sp.]
MLSGKTLVFGTGKSGLSSAALLKRQGADVLLYNSDPDTDIDKVRAGRKELADAKVIVGDITDSKIKYDNVVLSPGVAIDNPTVEYLRETGANIIGEIELGYIYGKGKIVAITGTNGKTTTTTLVGDIMRRKYSDVRVVGNIGNPYTDEADSATDDTVFVAEISSFQLETVKDFHADVSAILNITPDHLNRHYTMECYAECKERVTNKATNKNICVLNADNEYTADFAKRCPAKAVMFSSQNELEEGIFLRGDDIFIKENGAERKLMNVNEMNLVGTCNAENVMAAIAMGMAMEVPLADIIDTVKNFKAVEHRIEYTATKRGVKFYNDSKGTNPDAAIQGIKAMNGPTCLIGGGYDKGSEYDEWIDAFGDKVKKLVLLGQTAEKIADCAKKHGFNDIIFAETLEEAIDICYANAEAGENVLLSPACASWGMFDNYEQRGDIFKEYVKKLEE